MKKVKNIIAAGLILALAAGLAGCGGGGTSGEDVLRAAREKMQTVKSVNYDMTMDMNMSSNGQSMQTVTSVKVAMMTEPMIMKMDLSMDYGTQKMEIPMYAEEAEDGSFVMYVTADNGATWTKQTVADASVMEQYDAITTMDSYLQSVDSMKENGTEKVGDVDAVRYDGTITKDAMNEIMQAAGVEEQLLQLGLTQEQAVEMYKDLGEIPASVWIDKASSLPVKYEADMTAVMQTLMNNVVKTLGEGAEGMEFTVDKTSVTMVLSDFDQVEVVIPDAVKNPQ